METYGLEKLGILNPSAVYRNLGPAQLTEAALRRGEGKLSNTGALVVTTGKYTGRSPDDKFIVDTPAIHNDIAWGKVNRPIAKARFDAILAKVCAYLQGREIFIFDGFAGADPKYTKKFRIVNELASQNLFIHDLLIRFFSQCHRWAASCHHGKGQCPCAQTLPYFLMSHAHPPFLVKRISAIRFAACT